LREDNQCYLQKYDRAFSVVSNHGEGAVVSALPKVTEGLSENESCFVVS